MDEVNKVSNPCIICRKYRKSASKPVVAMPITSKFNKVISMDLKMWANKYFFSYDRQILFGAPKKILSDNDGEFNNEEMCALAVLY